MMRFPLWVQYYFDCADAVGAQDLGDEGEGVEAAESLRAEGLAGRGEGEEDKGDQQAWKSTKMIMMSDYVEVEDGLDNTEKLEGKS